jgi:hypothetical protein
MSFLAVFFAERAGCVPAGEIATHSGRSGSFRASTAATLVSAN